MAKKKDTSSDSSSPIDADIQALGYEEAVEKLEELVESIERGDVGLEQSLASYRRGEMLLRHCRALLDRADLSVREMSLSDAENGGTN
ncbi:MAG: exodeoxyribonuclease VII small subunit [Phycisphaerales bacterium]